MFKRKMSSSPSFSGPARIKGVDGFELFVELDYSLYEVLAENGETYDDCLNEALKTLIEDEEVQEYIRESRKDTYDDFIVGSFGCEGCTISITAGKEIGKLIKKQNKTFESLLRTIIKGIVNSPSFKNYLDICEKKRKKERHDGDLDESSYEEIKEKRKMKRIG